MNLVENDRTKNTSWQPTSRNRKLWTTNCVSNKVKRRMREDDTRPFLSKIIENYRGHRKRRHTYFQTKTIKFINKHGLVMGVVNTHSFIENGKNEIEKCKELTQIQKEV